LEIVERLRHLVQFAHLSPAQRDVLAGCAGRRVLATGDQLLKEGQTSAETYVVESGRVRIQRETPYGSFALATLGPGEIFGETAFVDQQVRSTDAVAETDCELIALDPRAMHAAMEADQTFAIALYWTFWKTLAKKLRKTNDTLTAFFTHTTRPPSPVPAPARPPGADFRVDMAVKRGLFQEQRLSSMEINFLASLSQERKFGAGQVIFREGEPGDAMWVVLEGRVMISKHIPGAGEEALAFLERGDYFGEMALIDNQPRSADAKAHEGGVVCLAIPRDVVEGLLDIHRVSSVRLLRILCSLVAKRLREVDDKIVGWHILAAGGSGEINPPHHEDE
jgi:CRP-like cAMP-binding protein